MFRAISLVLLLQVLAITEVPAQRNHKGIEHSIQYSDTLNFLLIDSAVHNFGTVAQIDTTITKYLRNIGKDTLIVTRALTTDPHFICDFPREKIAPMDDFSISICCIFVERKGMFRSQLGLRFSDGSEVSFQIRGRVE